MREANREIRWLFLVVGCCISSVVAYAQPSIPKQDIPSNASVQVRKQLERLWGEDAREKCDAAERLGRMGKRAAAAVPFLASMFADESSYHLWPEGGISVRECVASALSQLGEPGFEALVAALAQREPYVRAKAAEYLGISRNPRAIPALAAALWQQGYGDESDVPFARQSMVWALGKLRAIEPLIEALRDDDLRFAAGQALAEIGRPALPWLIKTSETSDPEIHACADEILQVIRSKKRELETPRGACSGWKRS